MAWTGVTASWGPPVNGDCRLPTVRQCSGILCRSAFGQVTGRSRHSRKYEEAPFASRFRIASKLGTGGLTLADAWTTRSSRRFKTNIQPLEGALEKIVQLQGVSYERKADGKHEIGVLAEDVDRVVPEV